MAFKVVFVIANLYIYVEKVASGLFSLINCVEVPQVLCFVQGKVGQDAWKGVNGTSLAVYSAKKFTVNYGKV